MRSGSTWSQTTKFTSPDGFSEDHFGASVSILGDQLIVGAHQPNSGHLHWTRQSLFVFTHKWLNWNYTAGLSAADGRNDDEFGAGVAISANHCIAGAPEHDAASQNRRGKVYFFKKQ
jgi:hypothetical protein